MTWVGHVAFKSLYQWHCSIQPDACKVKSFVSFNIHHSKIVCLYRTGPAAKDKVTPCIPKMELPCTLDALCVPHGQTPECPHIQILVCKID